MALTIECYVLLLIRLPDPISTLLVLSRGLAFEGNPLMSFYLRFGVYRLPEE